MIKSKYADKRNKPQCAATQCKEYGTELALAGGRPAWLCPDHAKAVKK